MLERAEKRYKKLSANYERVRRLIERGSLGGEEDRLWLEQFAKGIGLDICCGDMVLGDASGVDPVLDVIGTDWFLMDGTDLRCIENESQDFLVCNYLDAFSNTLTVLREWNRVLKVNGTLALVVRDANKYDTDIGPFINNKRMQCFTTKTLPFFLCKTGFKISKLELGDGSIRCLAIK